MLFDNVKGGGSHICVVVVLSFAHSVRSILQGLLWSLEMCSESDGIPGHSVILGQGIGTVDL